MKKSVILGVLLPLLASLSVQAFSDEPDQAQMLFYQGMQQERVRQYTEAIASYSQASSLTTTVFRAYISRQAGNCYYYLGLTREALVAYNIYLGTYRDPKTLQIATYLYRSLKAAPKPAATPVKTVDKLQPSEEGKFGALWRSVVIPGWGQWNRGDQWRGAAYFGGTAGAFALGFSTQSAADANYESYKKSTDPKQALDLRGQVTQQDQFASVMMSAALAVYALNLADAFFFTSTPEKTAWKPCVGPYALEAGKFGASLAWSF